MPKKRGTICLAVKEKRKSSKNLDEAIEFCLNPKCQLEDFNSKGKNK